MPLLSRFVVMLAAVALCAPAVALGQSSTIAQDGAGVSSRPPVNLGGDDRQPGASAPATPPATAELPNTGSDPRMLFLAGIALMLIGVGLRLRTADADLY